MFFALCYERPDNASLRGGLMPGRAKFVLKIIGYLKSPTGVALMPICCVVLFAKDYFLLRAKAISGKERLADQHKGLTQKISRVNQWFL